MKTNVGKKIALHILSVNLIRLSFFGIMILGVSFASKHTNQPPTMSVNKKVLSVVGRDHQPSDIKAPLKQAKEEATPDCDKKVECDLHSIILDTASNHQLDPALIKAIIMAESGYKIRAISKKGAKGLMQLMPGTARALGVTDVFDPEENISGGVRYFKQLVNEFNGDIKLALAAYNAGSRKVKHYNGIPPYKATRYYIKKVFEYYQLYKNRMSGNVGKA